jgi:hypothetical protein
MLAALAMAMSSVTVVSNSILLGRYKPRLVGERKEKLGHKEQENYSEKDVKEVFVSKTSS